MPLDLEDLWQYTKEFQRLLKESTARLSTMRKALNESIEAQRMAQAGRITGGIGPKEIDAQIRLAEVRLREAAREADRIALDAEAVGQDLELAQKTAAERLTVTPETPMQLPPVAENYAGRQVTAFRLRFEQRGAPGERVRFEVEVSAPTLQLAVRDLEKSFPGARDVMRVTYPGSTVAEEAAIMRERFQSATATASAPVGRPLPTPGPVTAEEREWADLVHRLDDMHAGDAIEVEGIGRVLAKREGREFWFELEETPTVHFGSADDMATWILRTP